MDKALTKQKKKAIKDVETMLGGQNSNTVEMQPWAMKFQISEGNDKSFLRATLIVAYFLLIECYIQGRVRPFINLQSTIVVDMFD